MDNNNKNAPGKAALKKEKEFELLFKKILSGRDSADDWPAPNLSDSGMLALLFARYPEQEARLIAKIPKNSYSINTYLRNLRWFALRKQLEKPPTIDNLLNHPYFTVTAAILKSMPVTINNWAACWKRTLNQNIRGLLAAHEAIPDDMIPKVAAMKSKHILAGLACNKKCPMFILLKLSTHPEPSVAHRAKETIRHKGGTNNGH